MPTRHFDARQRSSRRCTALETATQVSHHSPRLTPVSAIAYRPGRARPAAFRRANSATKSCAPVVLKCHGRRTGIAAPRRAIRGSHRPKLRRERSFLVLISCSAGIRVRASRPRHTRARLRRSHRFAFHASRRKQPACLSFPPRLRRPAPSLTADQTPRTALRRPSTWLTKARFPPSCAITAPAWSRCVNVPRSGHTPETCSFRSRSGRGDAPLRPRRAVRIEDRDASRERTPPSETYREIERVVASRGGRPVTPRSTRSTSRSTALGHRTSRFFFPFRLFIFFQRQEPADDGSALAQPRSPSSSFPPNSPPNRPVSPVTTPRAPSFPPSSVAPVTRA